MKRPSLKDQLAGMSAKREAEMSTKSDDVFETKSAVEEAIPAAVQGQRTAPPTLPKVTLYAHADVIKAVRRLAVEDGVQAQVILRRALKDYLASRGHHFTDLTTGQ